MLITHDTEPLSYEPRGPFEYIARAETDTHVDVGGAEIDMEWDEGLMGLQWGTQPGRTEDGSQRPNEDAHAIVVMEDRIVFGVFDGVTSQQKYKELGTETAAHFASHLCMAALGQVAAANRHPRGMLLALDDMLADYTKQNGLQPEHPAFLPSTTAVVTQIRRTTDMGGGVHYMLDYASAGDTRLIHYKPIFYRGEILGEQANLITSSLITIDTNASYDQDVFAKARELMGEDPKLTPREAIQDPVVRAMLQASFRAKMNVGVGVLNGTLRPALERYPDLLQFGTSPFGIGHSLVQFTDGYEPFVNLQDPGDRTRIFHRILGGDGFMDAFDDLITLANEDLERYRYERQKHDDDKTVQKATLMPW